MSPSTAESTNCAYLLSRLDSNAITLGLSWPVLGGVVLALITRGFKVRCRGRA